MYRILSVMYDYCPVTLQKVSDILSSDVFVRLWLKGSQTLWKKNDWVKIIPISTEHVRLYNENE